MRDVDNDLINRAGIVLVDSKEACSLEAGELITAGLSSESEQLVELGELFGKDGEETRSRVMESGDVTIFKSVSISVTLLPSSVWGVGTARVIPTAYGIRRSQPIMCSDICSVVQRPPAC